MKKILVLVLVSLVLVGGGFFAYMKVKNPSSTVPQNITNLKNKMTKNSLSALMQAGVPVTCKTTSEDGSKNTFYLSGDTIRNEVTVTQDNTTIHMNVLKKGNTIYMWNSDENKGTKMTVTEDVETSAMPKEDQAPKDESTAQADSRKTKNPLDLSAEMDMSCSPWVVISTMLTPPSNVEFTDITQLMQGLTKPNSNTATQNVPESTNFDMSEICSGITDQAAKAECVAALQKSR